MGENEMDYSGTKTDKGNDFSIQLSFGKWSVVFAIVLLVCWLSFVRWDKNKTALVQAPSRSVNCCAHPIW